MATARSDYSEASVIRTGLWSSYYAAGSGLIPSGGRLGEAGEGTVFDTLTSTKIPGTSSGTESSHVSVVQVAFGDGFAVARTDTGELFRHGVRPGETGVLDLLNTGTSKEALVARHWVQNWQPVKVLGLSSKGFDKQHQVRCVAAGQDHAVFVNNLGVVFTFGRNMQGQLGRKTEGPSHEDFSPSPVMWSQRTPVRCAEVGAADFYSVALSLSGEVYGWGECLLLTDADGDDPFFETRQPTPLPRFESQPVNMVRGPKLHCKGPQIAITFNTMKVHSTVKKAAMLFKRGKGKKKPFWGAKGSGKSDVEGGSKAAASNGNGALGSGKSSSQVVGDANISEQLLNLKTSVDESRVGYWVLQERELEINAADGIALREKLEDAKSCSQILSHASKELKQLPLQLQHKLTHDMLAVTLHAQEEVLRMRVAQIQEAIQARAISSIRTKIQNASLGNILPQANWTPHELREFRQLASDSSRLLRDLQKEVLETEAGLHQTVGRQRILTQTAGTLSELASLRSFTNEAIFWVLQHATASTGTPPSHLDASLGIYLRLIVRKLADKIRKLNRASRDDGVDKDPSEIIDEEENLRLALKELQVLRACASNADEIILIDTVQELYKEFLSDI